MESSTMESPSKVDITVAVISPTEVVKQHNRGDKVVRVVEQPDTKSFHSMVPPVGVIELHNQEDKVDRTVEQSGTESLHDMVVPVVEVVEQDNEEDEFVGTIEQPATESVNDTSAHVEVAEQGSQVYDVVAVVGQPNRASETSTIEFRHETFETFKFKALQIFYNLFPCHSNSVVKVERLIGGSFNRVISITVTRRISKAKQNPWLPPILKQACGIREAKVQQQTDKYVLRIPRQRNEKMASQIATLAYAYRNLPWPVPHNLIHDLGENNALGQAYMLQSRLPGESLVDLWPKLNLEQKKSATRQITQIVLDLHKLTSRSPGTISSANSAYDLGAAPKLDSLPLGHHSKETTPAPRQTTILKWILDRCNQWKSAEDRHEAYCTYGAWDSLANMAKKLHKSGLLPDQDAFHLCHQDLQLRNVMAVVEGNETVNISGVLDWDSAIFAPKFVSLRAPFFLWTPYDADEEDESLAPMIPEDPEHKVLKKLYESLVDPAVLRIAYAPEYILARQMFQLLQWGFETDFHIKLAEKIRDGFEKLRL
jgi:aminoglycoside phosphotransferase (APT) family kinase protein